ncbi:MULTISPECIES: peptidylprolyl isomerase [Solibacillus]|uniref:Peptidyl-prolyl cis-trans isomerase n=1 Tax=Solibacillus merdavium TaxID=2762218 RepID=A0ABR8XNT0_9BACL|nr:peptidylprolyl isomerase [Solibacillus merdavium]MBD8033606.1 peptidylprolyl isomerase [Solibacillus merdavium]
MKKFYWMLFMASIMLVLTACGTETTDNTEQGSAEDYTAAITENPIVTITMENDEKIVIELEPKVAPNTVANFISLVENGFYDGLIFHRVIPGFMVQGGDPDGTGMGGPDYSIKGEFSSNGFENTLTHDRGVLSMARTNQPDSAGSQFFIMVEPASHLDGDYASFGEVIEGMEVIDKIVAVERDGSDKPIEDQKMKTVEVDTKGFDYPEPVVQK